jgi:hypothetical protein
MYPHERSLVAEYRNRPFVLLGVNSDRDRDAIRKVIEEKQLSWRSFWNGGSTEGPISRSWNVFAWPTLYVLDHEGVIRHKNVRGEELDAAIAGLVAEAEAEAAR